MIKNRRMTAIALTLMCICLALPAASEQNDNAQPVRVGFFAFDGYHMQDENGNRSGYGYDFMRRLDEYTDLSFEYVNYDASFHESMDMLQSGEIDLLTSAQRTPENEARFDFSKYPIGASASILTVKEGNSAYILDNYASWSGMRVGLIEGSARNNSFYRFAEDKEFTYSEVFFGSMDEMLSELKGGSRIDAAVTGNMRHTAGEWILAQFDPAPFYIMTRKGNTALLADIDEALGRLYAATPNLDTQLMDKYYFASSGESVSLSVEEQALIEKSRQEPITVGIITSAAPVCYYDEEAGQFVGISMEILKTVSSKTGLSFKYEPIDLTGNSPIGWLKAGRYDLVAGIIKSQAFIDDPGLVLSDRLMTDSLIMVGRLGDDFTRDPKDKTIAVLAGFQVGMEYVSSQFPEHKLSKRDTFMDCMRDVAKGRADATVYTRICASYSFQDPHFEDLEVIPAFSREISTCIAGLAPDKQVLMGLINKGLAMIDSSQRTAILMNYTIMNPYNMSVKDVLYKYRMPLTVIIALLLAVVAVFVMLLSHKHRSSKRLSFAFDQAQIALSRAESVADKLRRQIMLTRQWQEASETDELTGLLNRRGGEQRIKSILELGECGLFCLFDIDKFKSINDRFGHETGDAALEAIAQCMRTFRGSDIQMRFGGDEFIVYAMGISTEEQALACAKKFLDAVNAIDIAGMEGTKISISMGMHLCAKDESLSFSELYKLADAAMYKCKNSDTKLRFG